MNVRVLPDWSRTKRVFSLGLPIMGGMSTYVFLELIDMLFVGSLGTVALAAVGVSAFVGFVYLAVFSGVSIAVQATTSRLVGEGRTEELTRYLNAGLVIVLIAAPLTSAPLVWGADVILDVMTDDSAVVATGVPYLRWMLATGVFFAVNSAFMGFWNATDRAQIYLRVVIAQAVVNVPANYVFMFGLGPVPAFGVEGVGIGTFISSIVGVGYHVVLGLRRARGFPRATTTSDVRVLVRLMVPVGFQQFFEHLALAAMFRIVALIGTVEMAAYSVLVNLIGAVGLPAWGLGLAGATLVGQAMGRKDVDDAHQWAWDVVKVGTLAMVVLGMPFWLAPEFVLSLFIHEADALAAATTPCRVLGLMISVNGFGYMFTSMLNGAGDVKRVMYINLATQYLVLVPGAYLFGVYWGFGLIGVWLVHQIGFRAFNSLIFTAMWQQKRWVNVQLW